MWPVRVSLINEGPRTTHVSTENTHGPVKDVDPQAAASRRAARRQEEAAAVAVSGAADHVPWEVTEAEEDDPDEVDSPT